MGTENTQPQGWQQLPQAVRDAVLRELQSSFVATANAEARRVTAVERTALMPASFEQRYVMERQQKNDYSLAWATTLTPMPLENVDLVALEKALTTMQANHESMRTRLVEKDGELYQVIDAEQPLPYTVNTLRWWNVAGGVEQIVNKQQQELVSIPFVPEAGPLWRARLVRQGDKAVLLMSFCSLIFDGGSMNVLQYQLHSLYTAYKEGEEPDTELMSETLQYADFATWQHQQVDSSEWQKKAQWWENKLAGGPPPVEFKGTEDALHTKVFKQRLGTDTGKAIKEYAVANNTTPFVVMLTTFMELLAELDSTDDIWVTAPSAGRPVQNTHAMVGNFMRQVLLRQQWFDSPDLLHKVHETVTESLYYGELPHALVAQQMGDNFSAENNPFRYFFNYRDVAEYAQGIQSPADGDDVDVPYIADAKQQFVNREEHILLMVEENGDRRELSWFFRLDRFREQDVEILMKQYIARLQKIGY